MTLRRLLTAGVLALLWLSPAFAATTLLPNGKQCFATANGVVSGGFVGMYVPGTTTFKQTWQDAGQVTLNVNPVPLDANGCAVIYGVGSYRQIVQDASLNTIWDQVTTDTSASNSVFIAGVAGGSPNVITVIDPGFNGTDGIISFVANATNTGPATLNPSGFGAIPIQKDSTTGPIALTGNEIVAGNVVNVQFSANQNAFHILNLISTASAAVPALCGASGLKITNGSLPNQIAAITADQVVMTSPAGLAITRNNVSISVNLTINGTAGGTDVGGNPPNTWYNLYAIDNGLVTAGLASQSSSAPTMPSGYLYRCRLGAMRSDGTANLFRTIQLGADARWSVQAVGNTTSLPIIAANALGNPVTGVYAGPTVSGSTVQYSPPTATAVDLMVVCPGGTTQSIAIVAGNLNYGTYQSASNAPQLLCDVPATTGIQQSASGRILLENAFVGYAAQGSPSPSLLSLGWHDKVNAN